MKDDFKIRNWKGNNITREFEYSTHLRFIANIVIMTETMEDLSILEVFSRVFKRVG